MGGLDEVKIARLGESELRSEIQQAILATQKRRLILAPGCSVPNDIADEPLLKVRDLVQKSWRETICLTYLIQTSRPHLFVRPA